MYKLIATAVNLFLALMFWQETSFPENVRQTAFTYWASRAGPGFNFGGPETGQA